MIWEAMGAADDALAAALDATSAASQATAPGVPYHTRLVEAVMGLVGAASRLEDAPTPARDGSARDRRAAARTAATVFRDVAGRVKRAAELVRPGSHEHGLILEAIRAFEHAIAELSG